MHTEILQIAVPIISMLVAALAWWRLRLKKLHLYQSTQLGKIEVFQKFNGEKFLTINSYPQGVSIEQASIKKSYWYAIARSAINLTRGKTSPHILILGLGANTSSNLIAKMNRKTSQTIVEFDENIIAACRDYFGLDQLPNTEVILADAYKLLGERALKQQFDCIIVDIFTGTSPYVSPESNKPTFINTLTTYLKKDGGLVFNRPGHTEKARAENERFRKELEQLFKETKMLDIKDPRGYRNNVIIASLKT